MKNRYFKVVTKCGHVGRYHCIWIEFAIVAESKQQAADKVREEGRVKRDHKDFIKEIKEISFEEGKFVTADEITANNQLFSKYLQKESDLLGMAAELWNDYL